MNLFHRTASINTHGEIRAIRPWETQIKEGRMLIGPDLAVTVDQALRGITLYAARQLGMGDRIGSLEVGKEADFTLLESDPYATDPGQLSAIKVSETWVEGARVQP